MIGRLISYIRAPFLIFFNPGFTIFCSMLMIGFFVPFTSRKTCDEFIRRWAKIICWFGGVKVVTKGFENFEKIDSAVLVSNHLGIYDIPTLYTVVPLSFRMAAKVELFKIPFFGRALRAAGFIPVVRGNTRENSRVNFLSIVKRFQNHESFWMAPEGTRFEGVGVGEFKLGAFFLSSIANRPIIPICIYGTQLVQPKHSLFVNWGWLTREVYIHAMPPIYPDQFKSEDEVSTRHSLKDYARNQIVDEFFRLHESNADRRPATLTSSSSSLHH